MTREEIVALFERREAAWRARDAAALARDHAPSGVVISPTGGVLEGRGDIERIYRVWFNAFADFSFAVEDLIVEGERVALLGRVTGRHSGEFFGILLPLRGRLHRPRAEDSRLHGPARPGRRPPCQAGRRNLTGALRRRAILQRDRATPSA